MTAVPVAQGAPSGLEHTAPAVAVLTLVGDDAGVLERGPEQPAGAGRETLPVHEQLHRTGSSLRPSRTRVTP